MYLVVVKFSLLGFREKNFYYFFWMVSFPWLLVSKEAILARPLEVSYNVTNFR